MKINLYLKILRNIINNLLDFKCKMGWRGLLRDLIGLFIGFKLILNLIMPLSPNDFLIYGLILVFFSSWFLAERIGLIQH